MHNILFISNHMKRQKDTIINMVHPNLGYIHNGWRLYYFFYNHLRLAHCAYNRCVMISFSPSCLSALYCKPLSTTLLLHSDINFLGHIQSILLLFSQMNPYSTQPITYLYIDSRAQNTTWLTPKTQLQLILTHTTCIDSLFGHSFPNFVSACCLFLFDYCSSLFCASLCFFMLNYCPSFSLALSSSFILLIYSLSFILF